MGWCENSLLEFGGYEHCVWMCICVWKSNWCVCVYHCKYIVYIISFYSFVLVVTVQASG